MLMLSCDTVVKRQFFKRKYNDSQIGIRWTCVKDFISFINELRRPADVKPVQWRIQRQVAVKTMEMGMPWKTKLASVGEESRWNFWRTGFTCLWTWIMFHHHHLSKTNERVSSSLGDGMTVEGKPPVFINQVFWEHDLAHLFMYLLIMLNSRMNRCALMVHKLNIFTIGPFKKKFASPCYK